MNLLILATLLPKKNGIYKTLLTCNDAPVKWSRSTSACFQKQLKVNDQSRVELKFTYSKDCTSAFLDIAHGLKWNWLNEHGTTIELTKLLDQGWSVYLVWFSLSQKTSNRTNSPKQEDILTEFTALCGNDWCSFGFQVRRGDTKEAIKKCKEHAEFCEAERKRLLFSYKM